MLSRLCDSWLAVGSGPGEGASRPARPLPRAGRSQRRAGRRGAVGLPGAGLPALPRIRDAAPRPAARPGGRRGPRRPRALPRVAAPAPGAARVALVRAAVDVQPRPRALPREPLRARGALRGGLDALGHAPQAARALRVERAQERRDDAGVELRSGAALELGAR